MPDPQMIEALMGRKSLGQSVQDATGLLPNVDRPGLLPKMHNGNGFTPDVSQWTAPEWLYQAAKAYTLPGHAVSGGAYNEGDVTEAALTIGGGGLLAGRAPQGVLGMAHQTKKPGLELQRALADSIKNKDKDVFLPPLSDRRMNELNTSNSKGQYASQPVSIPDGVINKFGYKRGGIDGQSPEDVAGMVNALLYGSRTKVTGSKDPNVDGLVIPRENNSYFGVVSPDHADNSPVLVSAYSVPTKSLPNKIKKKPRKARGGK